MKLFTENNLNKERIVNLNNMRLTRYAKLTGKHRRVLKMINDKKDVNNEDINILSSLRWFDYINREFYYYTLTEKAYNIKGIKRK